MPTAIHQYLYNTGVLAFHQSNTNRHSSLYLYLCVVPIAENVHVMMLVDVSKDVHLDICSGNDDILGEEFLLDNIDVSDIPLPDDLADVQLDDISERSIETLVDDLTIVLAVIN